MFTVANALTLAALTALPGQPQPIPSAQGRFNFGGQLAPNVNDRAAAYNAGAVTGARAGYSAGFRTAPVTNPYYASGYYGPGYYDPVGSFTSGVADIIGAQGQFGIDYQQAEAMREQNKQAKIVTRRKNFEEWQYERANTPTLEDERERARAEEVRRSRNDPPLTEIWSGKALNDLLTPILKLNPPSESNAPYVPLDPDLVRHINLTSGTTFNNLGVLKDNGKLDWPLALTDDQFEENRKKLEALGPQAFKEAYDGKVQPKTIRDLRGNVEEMTDLLKKNVGKISTNDYLPARRYLTELDSSIRTLQDPDVGKYATGKWTAHGDSIYALTADISRQGLRFGPAVDGDQAAYVSVHRGMVRYLSALQQFAGH
jgi:hypothetical protein